MANHLKHVEEFNKILADYQPSAESQALLKDINLILLAAPSASGRNTIITELLKTNDYSYIVSDTTRKPRINKGIAETNGVEYWFRSEGDVLADIREGKFLEAAVIHAQQVSGISVRELERAHTAKKIAITDVEVQGVDKVLKAKPNTIAIFVLPPSFEEWQQRLHGRGEMLPIEVRRRMESAVKEFAAALEHDYYKFILNDTLDHATEQIHKMAMLGEVNPREQESYRELAERLYTETVKYLQTLPRE